MPPLHITGATDPLTGRETSVAMADGIIVPAPPPGSREIDGRGLFLLPGLIDSHLHLLTGGVALGQLNLLEVKGEAAFRAALAAYAEGRDRDPVLCCWSANYDIFGPGTRPDRHLLDRICPDRPLLMTSVDWHCAWANTAALRLAGLMETVPEMPGVILGPDGLPDGELQEFAAMGLVQRHAASGGREGLALAGREPAAPDAAARAHDRAALAAAMAECARFGITAVANMDGSLYLADLLTDMATAGELPIRVSLPMTVAPDHDDARVAALLDAACRPPAGRLSFGRVKMFMDGVFDTFTALRTDDYPGRPGFRSAPLFPADRFAEVCIAADARGLQIQTHAVGDGAVRAVLDGYEAAQRANGRRDARHRVEHIDMLHPDDLPRLRDLGATASMQPVHPPGSSGLPLEPTVSIMGRARWGDTFPWAAIARAGVPLAFGTDWPTAPLSPFNAIHAALARQPWAPDGPDQRLPLAGVLAAYTSGGAHALHMEDRRRRLAPGMEADLVLLEGDPAGLARGPGACRAALTVCGGAITHEALP
ncbi:amidohydrolase [Mangrovicoccus algicola]|uniref:Amidohydrolase n=1 Tax=Mangrovicoccus algicola TaxID=2771008 RepID=A0A8J7CI91_9RHOB|nr:amidohydrolase [Mangrovicoccus algicola]MBE3639300.1 amidohydrolase [Mangrovicoccus algicola]